VKRVFIDTSGFYALLIVDDHNHARAEELFRVGEREGWRLVTTNAVVVEAHALFLYRSRPGRQNALRFLDTIESEPHDIVRVRTDDERKAIALIRTHRDKMYSLCDALSFVVMERLRIRDAISFDEDFRSYGRFTIL
jgi:uncharacterized protein